MTNIWNVEILQIAEAVARDKNISKEQVIKAMEEAVSAAAKKKYGHEHNIVSEIDKKSGEIKLYRKREIVESIENYITQISLEEALLKNPEAVIGEFVFEQLPPIDLGRSVAQTAKHVIVNRVREAERERQYNDFIDRVGDIVSGSVKRIEAGNVVVDLGGRAEAMIRKSNLIKTDMFKQNDRIRAYVEDVKKETKGPQIYLSRTCNNFLAKLFMQEVPEIYDGVIEIKAVAREPGSRAKIAVYSNDMSLDPIGSCVGVRGARVQAVMSELNGEKIDIIPWSNDPATFVINALSPVEVSKVIIDEEKSRIEVVIPSDHLSMAIGRRGQNVRLVSQLTGWNIDVLTEDQESKRRIEEFNMLSKLFIEALDVEEVIANLLTVEGFNSIEDVAYASISDLAAIEGFDENVAEALITRAKDYLDGENEKLLTELNNLGVEKELIKLVNLDAHKMLILAHNGIKSIEDLADLSTDEFVEILPNSGLSQSEIDSLIMQSRS